MATEKKCHAVVTVMGSFEIYIFFLFKLKQILLALSYSNYVFLTAFD